MSDYGLTVTVPVAERYVLAVIVTVAALVTFLCVTVNVPVVCPAATTIDAGTVPAARLLLFNDTVIPPVGAGPFS